MISKLPRAGRTKTRLARTLGPRAALALHRAFLEDELIQLHAPSRWDLHLVHDDPQTDEERAELGRLLRGRARSLSPGGTGLAAELLGAFRLLLERHERAVIVSGDVPHLSPRAVADALGALDEADLVLGAGPDGGYYLVGLREPHDVFTSIPMGTEAVERATVALARRQGLRVAAVESMTDIDEAQDLLELDRAPPELAVDTRKVVARLERSEYALSLPSELQIEPTNRCNMRCNACKRTHVRLARDADLTLADYRHIVRDLPRLERVAFQLNGEPLLCDDVFAMIRHAVDAGARTVMNSNATLLDRRRRHALLDCGLHELRVSLDGASREAVERMAGADVLEVVSRGVRALTAERGAGELPRVSLWMVATRDNIEELPGLVRVAAEIGADEVYAQRLVLTGHGVAVAERSLHGQIDEAIREVVARAEEVAAEVGVAVRASGRRPVLESFAAPEDAPGTLACWRAWRSAVVTAEQRVLPCCISSFVVDYDALQVGDLRRQTWPEIWNGEPYRALRRGILTGAPVRACASCGACWSL